MAADDKVVINQTKDGKDPEAVLTGYLVGVEALRAGKEALLFLTSDGIMLASEGYITEALDVEKAPSTKVLHDEYVERGGKIFVCPVCVKTHNMEDATWIPAAEVKGVPALFEFTAGGALVFNF